MAFNGKGFIIDAPKVLLKTANGNSHLATASQGQVTLGGDSLELVGGWSFYNISRIDTKKTLMVSLTDAQWDLDALWLSSGGAKTQSASEFYYFGNPYTVHASTYTVTLTGHVAVASSVEINGYTETAGTTPTATQFWVSNNGTDTTLHFNSAAASDVVYPAYKVATVATTDILTVQTTDFASAGSAFLQFPIYSDADAADSTIVAYAQMEVYKVKIMPTYEFSGSYKTASNFKLDLEGLDPRRSDGNMWQLIVNPV
jgi:hypothetical protein